ILVDGKCAPPLAVFQNAQGESEALVISRNSLGNDELYHVAREPLSDSGWNICGLGAHPMAIAVADSQMLWAVGTDRQFWQNQAGRWSQTVAPLPDGAYVPEPSISGSPAYVPLALGNDGIVRAVDSQGRLYAYDPTQNAPQGQWNLVACPYPLATAPVGGGDSFWAISNSQIVQYSAGTWQISDFPGEMVQQVCVGTDGSVWALDTQGNLYQWTNQQWQQISTAPQLLMLSVVTADQMWGISFNSPIAIWTGNGQTWALDSQAPPIGAIGMTGPQPQISTAADGTVWCIDSSGMPWRCISRRGPQWQRLMLPTGMSGFTATEGVAAVVVGKDQKALQAFYVRGEKLYQAQANPLGTWREFQRLGAGGTSLGITHQQDTGEMFVYGIDSKGNLITSRESNNYALYTFNAYGTLAGASVQINALSHEAWFTAAVMDGQLYVQWGSADSPLASGPCPGQMMSVTRSVQGGAAPSNLASLVPMPWLQTPVG
ncbi:MAG: hypothetical protein JSS02_35095, partial [Planctomycetes bacterium]|nr:hypothetical protein [Planctomycetota bacterium]